MPLDDSESMVQLMLLGVIESAINKALSLDADSLTSLSELSGKVVRIKTQAPYMSLYLMICDNGVQVFNQHDGPVDARIRAPARTLAWHVFGPPSGEDESLINDIEITVTGDRDLVERIGAIAEEFNLWTSVQRILDEWLPEYSSFDEIWKSLKSRDPIWIERLQYLPQMLNDTVLELRRHGDLQEKQLEEMRAIRLHLESQQRYSIRVVFVGLLCLLLAVLSATGLISIPNIDTLPIEAWLFGLLGLGLIVPRLQGR